MPSQLTVNVLRDAFLAKLQWALNDTRALWLPATGDTTTTTDRSRQQRVFTYSESLALFDVAPDDLGSIAYVDFNGTDEEADTPDTADLSFGNSAVDGPFSLVVLCKPDVNNVAMSLLDKEESAAAEEYGLELNASGHLVCRLTDESASATIIGTYASAVGTSWTLLGATYDGSMASVGIKCYKDGVGQTTVASGSGTYTAMENTAAKLHLASRYDTKAQFFNGRIALAMLFAKALSDEEMWSLKDAINAIAGQGL